MMFLRVLTGYCTLCRSPIALNGFAIQEQGKAERFCCVACLSAFLSHRNRSRQSASVPFGNATAPSVKSTMLHMAGSIKADSGALSAATGEAISN